MTDEDVRLNRMPPPPGATHYVKIFGGRIYYRIHPSLELGVGTDTRRVSSVDGPPQSWHWWDGQKWVLEHAINLDKLIKLETKDDLNSMVADYHIVREMNPTDLIAMVKRMMNDGWVPIGGVAVVDNPASSERGRFWMQAMVKPASKEPE